MVDGVERVKDIVQSLQSFVRRGEDNQERVIDIDRA